MQKKKNAKPFVKKYWPVVVHLDALEEIYDTMKETCEQVEVINDDYTFESLEDARKHLTGRPQQNFKLSALRPSASVEFSSMETSVYVRGGEKAAQLFHELNGILAPRQRWPHFLYSQWLAIPMLALSSSTSFVTPHMSEIGSLIYNALVVLAFAWFAWISFLGVKRHSVLFFERRNETKSFMEQNRNAIVLTIVTSLITGAIGFGFGKLKDWPTAATSNSPTAPSPKP